MPEVRARIDTSNNGTWAVCTAWLPVTPEVAFEAISTGEGISSWFVPCALEPKVGGRVILFADPGAPDPTAGPEAAVEASLTATVGEITEYAPPTANTAGRFVFHENHWMGPDTPVPPWITAIEVAAGHPGSGNPGNDDPGCTLTLKSGFESSGTLANSAVEESLGGWSQAILTLWHRLSHRPQARVITVLAATEPIAASVDELWTRTQANLPTNAATGDVLGQLLGTDHASATLALTQPVEGVLELFAFPSGENPEAAAVHSALALRLFEYVDDPAHRHNVDDPQQPAQAVGAAAIDGVAPTWDSPRWRDWLSTLVGA